MKIQSITYSSNIKNVFSPSVVKQKNAYDNSNSAEICNHYYAPVNFSRKWKEHTSWGAVIDPKTKDVRFKLFSYPDNKSVSVEVKDSKTGKTHLFPMKQTREHKGIYQSDVIPSYHAQHNDTYRYIIEKADGTIDKVKDPYSFRQKTLLGESVLYDHSLFNWSDKNWYLSSSRVSRKADSKNQLTPVENLRIYEFNTKTISQGGNFESAIKQMRQIKNLGFNAIEIMPVENTYSFNWGYDGVDKFAPAEHLGGPDKLKQLIDSAHNLGLNVIMDMVPNHFGPDGNTIQIAGPYISGPNAFGDAFNYEGENSEYVKDFIVNAAINWVKNYHCDGLRLDMTKFMESDYTMKQIAAEINYHLPDAFLIAEDARSNISVDKSGAYKYSAETIHDERVINQLQSWEYGGNAKDEQVHVNAIERISHHDPSSSLGRLGYDSEWDFALFHQLKETLYGNVDLDKLSETMENSQKRVKFLMSHDEIGNYDGTRLVSKLMVPMLSLNENIILNNEDYNRASKLSQLKGYSYDYSIETVKNQKAQLACEKLLKMMLSGKFDKYTHNHSAHYWLEPIQPEFIKEVLEPLGINPLSGTCPEKIREMYLKSYNLSKAAISLVYSTPGPKMVFQGDEKMDITPFRFFREFQSIEDDAKNLYIEKGYESGRKAMEESQIGNIEYSKYAQKKMNEYKQLISDLNRLSEQNPAMTDGAYIPNDTVKHHQSKLFAMHSISKSSDNELYTISNFEYSSYPRQDADKYYIRFPKGTWIELLNTDDKKYGGGGYVNRNPIASDGESHIPINVGRYSTLIFKKIA